jgi:Holliday junction resolvase
MRQIRGAEARAFLKGRIDSSTKKICEFLAPFNVRSAFHTWLQTFRAIEEFINIPLFELNDELLERKIIGYRLDRIDPDVEGLRFIASNLEHRFGSDVTQRFLHTIIQASSIGIAFRNTGHYHAAAGFENIGTAIGYFQSRRRHILALLYTLPTACRGARTVSQLDALNLFLPTLEQHGLALTWLYHQLMLSNVFADYAIIEHGDKFRSNHEHQVLDQLFLEPERLGLDEAFRHHADPVLCTSLQEKDPRKVFAAVEISNTIQLLTESYEQFGLSLTEFQPVAALIPELLEYCVDDYIVEVPARRFSELVNEAHLKPATVAALVNQASDNYVDNTNSMAPFIREEDRYLSTLTLLNRFLYQWKSMCLNRVRQFQIHSGFTFERTVKEALAEQGFTVIDIKRVNRKEFDVIAVLDGIIFNVQCKNNLIDYNQVERFPERIARYNRQLNRYYAKALEKEQQRERLLQDKLRLHEIRHVVVSRFPVATENPLVIPLAQLQEFRERFAAVAP